MFTGTALKLNTNQNTRNDKMKHYCINCGVYFEVDQDNIVIEEGTIIKCPECDEEVYFEKELLRENE